ncbi:MAG: CBS domain-containing protein [Tepidiformaceae bacterium]
MDRSRLSRFINQKLQELPLDEPAPVTLSTPVRDALSLMQSGSRSCVVAMQDGRLAGIFTERDVLTKCMDEGFDWDQSLGSATSGGRNVLTRSPQAIGAQRTVADAIATMQQHHYRTLPVLDGDQLIGLVRLGDLLTHLAEAYPEDVLNLPPRPHQVMERPEGG